MSDADEEDKVFGDLVCLVVIVVWSLGRLWVVVVLVGVPRGRDRRGREVNADIEVRVGAVSVGRASPGAGVEARVVTFRLGLRGLAWLVIVAMLGRVSDKVRVLRFEVIEVPDAGLGRGVLCRGNGGGGGGGGRCG